MCFGITEIIFMYLLFLCLYRYSIIQSINEFIANKIVACTKLVGSEEIIEVIADCIDDASVDDANWTIKLIHIILKDIF